MPATPGPWNFDRKSGFVGNAEKPCVCFIRGSAEDEEACANGDLISAAPEMERLLKAAREMMVANRDMLHELSANPNYDLAGPARDVIDKMLAQIVSVLAKANGVILQ